MKETPSLGQMANEPDIRGGEQITTGKPTPVKVDVNAPQVNKKGDITLSVMQLFGTQKKNAEDEVETSSDCLSDDLSSAVTPVASFRKNKKDGSIKKINLQKNTDRQLMQIKEAELIRENQISPSMSVNPSEKGFK